MLICINKLGNSNVAHTVFRPEPDGKELQITLWARSELEFAVTADSRRHDPLFSEIRKVEVGGLKQIQPTLYQESFAIPRSRGLFQYQ